MLFSANRLRGVIPFSLFLILLLGICICHLSTVKTYPTPWGDEVHLLELGRCAVFERNTDWSIILSPHSSVSDIKPALFPTYLSGAVTELLYRITGTFIVHRIFSLVGLAAASLLCCLWLIKKGFSPWAASMGAFLFATECHISRIAHFYRPDLWILAITFLCALWIMRLETRSRLRQYVQFGLLGGVLSFQLIYWFAAVFSWPILLAEVLLLAKSEKWSCLTFIRMACVTGMGFLFVVMLLLIIPFYHELGEMFGGLIHHPDLVTLQKSLQPAMESSWSRLSGGIDLFYYNTRTFFMLAARSPFLWTLSCIGLLCAFKRNIILGTVFLAQLFVILATNMYAQRIVYLLPGAVFFASATLRMVSESPYVNSHSGMRKAIQCFYGAAISFGLLLVVSINLIAGWGGGDGSSQFRAAVQKSIGAGPKRVYLFSWQPYFYARELGWKAFSFLPKDTRAILDPKQQGLLQTMDYILSNEKTNGLDDLSPLTQTEEDYLARQGFVKYAEIPAQECVAPNFVKIGKAFIFSYEYPPFAIWKNERTPSVQ